ncbi:MAG: caspase family protein [Bacteroidaceae bacterium]
MNCRIINRLSIISLLMLFLFVFAKAQTRRALVIGLGRQEDPMWNKINGDKDVAFVKEMLNNSGYASIKTLVNEQATKNNICKAFKNLISQCGNGDIVYVHYSGHGQQMRDRHNDELDGLDECWIPYDAYRKVCNKDRGEKHLTDDEINFYLNKLRDKVGEQGKILVVVDACHSGGSTRSNNTDSIVVRGVADTFNTNKKKTEITLRPERWITISACKNNQSNVEMKKPAVGKLTYAIYCKLKENSHGSNDAFFSQITSFIKRHTQTFFQIPEMTGEYISKYNITDILR